MPVDMRGRRTSGGSGVPPALRPIAARALQATGYHAAAAELLLADVARLPASSRALRKFLSAVDRVPGQAAQSPLIERMMATRTARPQPHRLPGRLVVSITSYPARYGTLHYPLRCLLDQT